MTVELVVLEMHGDLGAVLVVVSAFAVEEAVGDFAPVETAVRELNFAFAVVYHRVKFPWEVPCEDLFRHLNRGGHHICLVNWDYRRQHPILIINLKDVLFKYYMFIYQR